MTVNVRWCLLSWWLLFQQFGRRFVLGSTRRTTLAGARDDHSLREFSLAELLSI